MLQRREAPTGAPIPNHLAQCSVLRREQTRTWSTLAEPLTGLSAVSSPVCVERGVRIQRHLPWDLAYRKKYTVP
jgi:hypothetical protein